MADIKRIGLTNIGAPKKDKKSKSPSKTVRFTLALGESNEKTCSEFNFRELLSNEGPKKQPLEEKPTNGLFNFDDEDDSDVRAMAKKFEEKYGGSSGNSGKRKKKRSEEYVDLGAGYDDNDSFIDNTDAYDEIVPEEMTTAQGGFYINCGKLEYKQLETPVKQNGNQEEEEESEDEVVSKSKKAKQAIVSSDDSSDDDEEEDEDEESSREEETETEPPAPPPSNKIKDKSNDKLIPSENKIKSEESKKLKRPAENNNIGPLAKKKSNTVKDLLKEKRDTVVDKKKTNSNNNNNNNKTPASSCSILDSIESVINAARDASEEKPEKLSNNITITPTVSSQKTSKLPDNLPENIKSLVENLRQIAKSNSGNPNKFFSPSVERYLTRLEQKTMKMSSDDRHKIFGYIAECVVCSTENLMRKARKLLREMSKSRDPMFRLKAAINQVAPKILDTYQKECVEYNKNRILEKGDPIPPVKTFPWSSELRSLLSDAISKSINPNDENTLRDFLENQVCPLFPTGWMNVPTLQQEIQAVLRPKDTPSVVVPSPLTSPPPRSTSVITIAESPKQETFTRPSPISLKHRILQDAAFKTEEKQPEVTIKYPDSSNPLSIEKLLSDNKKTKKPEKETKERKPRSQSDKDKNKESTSNIKASSQKWSISNIINTSMERAPTPPKPPATNPEEEAKKEMEETARATDFLSQIIHESLTGYPNADTGKDERVKSESYPKQSEPVDYVRKHSEIRQSSDQHSKRATVNDYTKEALNLQTSENSKRSSINDYSKEVLNLQTPERRHTESIERSHNNDIRKDYRERERKRSESRHTPDTTATLDPEASVELEMKRVMQELIELNGLRAASDQPKSSHINTNNNRSSMSMDSYESGRSRVDKARSINMLSSNSDLSPDKRTSIYSNSPSPDKRSISSFPGTPSPDKRNSGVSVIAVNQTSRNNVMPMFGYQDEFQRHIMSDPQDILLASSPPSDMMGTGVVTAFRPSPSRQQANPYVGYGQSLPIEDLRASYFNQVHHLNMNSHSRSNPYTEYPPK